MSKTINQHLIGQMKKAPATTWKITFDLNGSKAVHTKCKGTFAQAQSFAYSYQHANRILARNIYIGEARVMDDLIKTLKELNKDMQELNSILEGK